MDHIQTGEQQRGEDDSLSQLIELARGGCRESQDQLFCQLQSYLMFVAKDHGGTELQAKFGTSDIVQRSLTVAVEQLSDFRGTTAAELRAWMRQILINQGKQARRGYAVDKRDVRRETSLEAGDSQPAVAEPADQQPTPATHALADEQADIVRRLITQLPETYQTVIRLRSWEELSFEEIAVRMNMSTSGAAKTWYRALVEIQELYRQENESRIH